MPIQVEEAEIDEEFFNLCQVVQRHSSEKIFTKNASS